MVSPIKQMPLPIRLDRSTTWQNWLGRDATKTMEKWLLSLSEMQTGAFVWGGPGSGKSHVLQACCASKGNNVLYLPLDQLIKFPADQVLKNVERMELIALDNIHSIEFDIAWQEQLFVLYNLCQENNTLMLCTSNCAPTQLDLLPDLRSRLSSLPVFHLPDFTEADVVDLVKCRAQKMGLQMSDEVVQFCAVRLPRQPRPVVQFVQALDRESLARSRPITIPFVRQLGLL